VAVPKFRAIIFDVGRVLIRVDISRAMDGLAAGLSLTPREVWSAIENDPHWIDWQEGRFSPRDWHVHLTKRLGASLTFEQFSEAWNLALDPNPILSESFLEKLSKNYRLALLSNTDAIHMSNEEARFPLFRFFPSRIYSYRVGVRKPDPVIYRQALQAWNARAEEAVYIDDVAANAVAARCLGMTGIVFLSPERLQSDLRSLGIRFGCSLAKQKIRCSLSVRVNFPRTSTASSFRRPPQPSIPLSLTTSLAHSPLASCMQPFFSGRSTRQFPKPG